MFQFALAHILANPSDGASLAHFQQDATVVVSNNCGSCGPAAYYYAPGYYDPYGMLWLLAFAFLAFAFLAATAMVTLQARRNIFAS